MSPTTLELVPNFSGIHRQRSLLGDCWQRRQNLQCSLEQFFSSKKRKLRTQYYTTSVYNNQGPNFLLLQYIILYVLLYYTTELFREQFFLLPPTLHSTPLPFSAFFATAHSVVRTWSHSGFLKMEKQCNNNFNMYKNRVESKRMF